jgi:hypothetical protein
MPKEIIVDVNELRERASYYSSERIDRIANILGDQAKSICGNPDEIPGATFCAVAAEDNHPIKEIAVGNKTVGLPAGTVTIGRSSDCDICISDDNQVSRLHATLTIHVSGKTTLRDLESSNGTFVNNHRVLEVSLHAGDKIQVGQTYLVLQGLLALPVPEDES